MVKKEIFDLDLSVKVYNRVIRAGINNIADLLACDPNILLESSELTKKDLDELNDRLFRLNPLWSVGCLKNTDGLNENKNEEVDNDLILLENIKTLLVRKSILQHELQNIDLEITRIMELIISKKEMKDSFSRK